MDAIDSRQGSSASRPDLDWSQVRETVLLLRLAAGQIEAAMREGHRSVDVLIDSFTTLAGAMRTIAATAARLPPPGEAGDDAVRSQLLHQADDAGHMVHASIVAFQFYDKLVQRLAHVCHSLDALGELVSDNGRLYNPAEWVGLQEKIRARYSTREEHEMFEAVLHGMSVAEALERYQQATDDGGGVELF